MKGRRLDILILYNKNAMNNFLVKFFYYADMFFMTVFIIAAVGLHVTWLSIASSVALLAFGVAGVAHALLTRKGRPENYIYVCGMDALVGLVAVIWGIVGGWWY